LIFILFYYILFIKKSNLTFLNNLFVQRITRSQLTVDVMWLAWAVGQEGPGVQFKPSPIFLRQLLWQACSAWWEINDASAAERSLEKSSCKERPQWSLCDSHNI